jgi:hypothetical protein
VNGVFWQSMPRSYNWEDLLDSSFGKPNAWGYSRVTLFLGEINTGTWPSRMGNLNFGTAKYGHKSRGTWARENCTDNAQQQL